LTFDIFNRHADKVAMANVAQTINCLHSLFLAHEDKFVRTPVYHVFDMYRPHMGAQSIPLRISTPELAVETLDGPARLPAASGSASTRERRLFATLTNFSLEAAMKVNLALGSANAKDARALVLTHADPQACNTWAQPEEVKPAELAVQITNGAVAFSMPSRSVISVEIDLAT
jgi:alpha-N-arabinofuranosidase